MPQNTVTIAGNLTEDPELRFTPNGQAVAKFRVAYSERYRDNGTGEWRDGNTSYFNVYAWADLGEHVAETFQRGNRVIVTGLLQQRTYETRDGEKRYSVEIRADDVGASVKFATARIAKASREHPSGPAANGDPWGSANPERPADGPAPAPDAEPAPDGSQEPADGPAEPAAATGARTVATGADVPRRSRPARRAAPAPAGQ